MRPASVPLIGVAATGSDGIGDLAPFDAGVARGLDGDAQLPLSLLAQHPPAVGLRGLSSQKRGADFVQQVGIPR
jgi:hypothetical protein